MSLKYYLNFEQFKLFERINKNNLKKYSIKEKNN